MFFDVGQLFSLSEKLKTYVIIQWTIHKSIYFYELHYIYEKYLTEFQYVGFSNEILDNVENEDFLKNCPLRIITKILVFTNKILRVTIPSVLFEILRIFFTAYSFWMSEYFRYLSNV